MTKEQASKIAQQRANIRKVNYCIYRVSNGQYLWASEEFCLKDERYKASSSKEVFYPKDK